MSSRMWRDLRLQDGSAVPARGPRPAALPLVLAVAFALSWQAPAVAQEPEPGAVPAGEQPSPPHAAAGEAVRFNPGFLSGGARDVDLSAFADGNLFIAGSYRVDVYVNGAWNGRHDLDFAAGEHGAQACLTPVMLEELGVDSSVLPGEPDTGADCRPLAVWIPGASERLDVGLLRHDLAIPQAYLRRTARGYVSPSLWDRGIDAGFIGYHLNFTDGRSEGSGGARDRRSAYAGLNAGLNLGGWQFRHDSSFSWVQGGTRDWSTRAAYVRRPVPAIRGLLTVGDSYTSGELFDSIAFRGVSLASDDRMLPDSLRGYAPVVRGIAETSATVEIRQDGQLIHSTSVAPGAFVIDDLYPTGYGGDLEVAVLEADGRRRSFRVPYGSVAQMLRPGVWRYAVTAGRVRNDRLLDEPGLLQATWQQGIANRLTLYGGATASEGYASLLYGAGVSTPLGAFALDATQARTDLDQAGERHGASVRLGYSNLVAATGTRFTLAAYRYSTQGYFSLNDAVVARDRAARGLDPAFGGRHRSQFQLTLNQPLGPRGGALYLTGALRDYWDRQGTTRDYQLGYNNAWGRVTYGLSAVRSVEPGGASDTRYLLSFSIPLGQPGGMVSVSGDLGWGGDGYDASRLGVSGTLGDDHQFSYGVAVSDTRASGTSAVATADYRARMAAFDASWSRADDYRQATVGATGTLVFHPGGITASPQRGDTMVVVRAPGARDASVQNVPGVRVDADGHALIPYVSPYRMNTVTLDPRGMSHDVELQATSRTIAPMAGAIGLLVFETRRGRALLIDATRPSGEALPFGARVLDASDQVVGMVGQGGLVYLRVGEDAGTMTVQWGEGAERQCTLDYPVPAVDDAGTAAFTRVEAECR